MDASTLLLILIVILSISYVWDQILDWLNLKALDPNLPSELDGIYEPEKYRKSQEYTRTKGRMGFLTSGFSMAMILAVLEFGLLGWLDNYLAEMIEGKIWHALAFFGVIFVLSDLVSLPFSLYSVFVIEEKFGFNRMNLKTYFVDKLKKYLLTGILGGGLLSLLILMVDWLGTDFWLLFWIVSAIFMLLAQILFPALILPLFNKFSPLEAGELKSAIDGYACKVGFPLKRIMVMDGSKRSSKSNAFFTGVGRQKQVVLFDTLIENHTTEELVAILAHEVGHYKKKHTIWSTFISIATTGFTLFLLSRMIGSPLLSEALGGKGLSLPLNLVAFGLLYSPVSEIMGLAMNAFSRKNEYEADAFAVETFDGEEMTNALKRIYTDNLSNLTPHPWYVFWHYSHPTLLQRLAAIRVRTSG